MTTPPTLSLWPFRYFVVLCTTRSAPSVDRLLDVRARERVVDDERRAARVGELGEPRRGRVSRMHRIGRRLDEQHARLRRERR